MHKKETERTIWHFKRDAHNIAFEEVCDFVEDNIIQKKVSYLLDALETIYKDSYSRALNNEGIENELELDDKIARSHLEDKLLKKFPKKVSIVKMNTRKIIKPYIGILIKECDLNSLEKQNILQKAALILRDEIKRIKHRKLPNPLNVLDLMNGECDIPKCLDNFYNIILSGPSYRRKSSSKTKRISKSLSSDLIHAVTNGNVKPSKHISFGLALKSLTNSKKIVNLCNRYGHCCSYTVLEELETEATFTSTRQESVCPEDILQTSSLCTGVAFNNFDRFVDTRTGKDTLHDTVGIIFQNVCASVEINAENRRNEIGIETDSSSNKKRRRIFDAITPEFEPYTKKPKLIEPLYPIYHPLHVIRASNLPTLQQLNFSWLISHILKVPKTPMWVGYNSLIHQDSSVMQRVSYLTSINKSPTENTVVLETMKQALKIAEECGEKYMQVTYDLAIAKVALQIQSTEKGDYKNLFIHIGSFHVMLAYFKAIGKFITIVE